MLAITSNAIVQKHSGCVHPVQQNQKSHVGIFACGVVAATAELRRDKGQEADIFKRSPYEIVCDSGTHARVARLSVRFLRENVWLFLIMKQKFRLEGIHFVAHVHFEEEKKSVYRMRKHSLWKKLTYEI